MESLFSVQETSYSEKMTTETSSCYSPLYPEIAQAHLQSWIVASCDEYPKHQILIGEDPSICGGDPIILGTRISVAFIAELHNLGWGKEEIHDHYPELLPDQVDAALEYYKSYPERIEAIIQKEKTAEHG